MKKKPSKRKPVMSPMGSPDDSVLVDEATFNTVDSFLSFLEDAANDGHIEKVRQLWYAAEYSPEGSVRVIIPAEPGAKPVNTAAHKGPHEIRVRTQRIPRRELLREEERPWRPPILFF